MSKKIIDLIKSKMKIHNKEIETLEAEKIIIAFNKPHLDKNQSKKQNLFKNLKLNQKKLEKSNQ